MPEKFIVPQFIDTEDKILGPITVRQFLILLGATFALFIEYKVFPLVYFILWAVVTAALAGLFGFVKINGQPFHLFFVNALQTLFRPNLRVWHKELSDSELRSLIAAKPAIPLAPTETKERPKSTALRDLTLVVNTGGVFKPEDNE